MPEALQEAWAERVAIMVVDGELPRAEAERLAWAGLQAAAGRTSSDTTGDAV